MATETSAKVLFSVLEDEKLVEYVAKYPCLYDLVNALYKNQSAKDNAWKEVAEYVGRSVDDCKKRWRNIKDTYIKKKKKGKGGTGSSANSKAKPWPLYEMLSFLGKVEHKRLSTSNVEVQESQNDDEIGLTESTEKNEDIPDSPPEVDNAPSTSKTATSPLKRNSPSVSRPRPQTSKKQKINDNLIRLMENRHNERVKIINSLVKYQEDDIDVFFKSISLSIKKLRPELQNEAKMQTLQMVIDLERRNNTPTVNIPQMSSGSSSLSTFTYSPLPTPPPSTPHMPDDTTDFYLHHFN